MDGNTEENRERKDRPTRNSRGDASGVLVAVAIRFTTISRRFVTMPIKADTLAETSFSLSLSFSLSVSVCFCCGSSQKCDPPRARNLAIYDTDDVEPKDRGSARYRWIPLQL